MKWTLFTWGCIWIYTFIYTHINTTHYRCKITWDTRSHLNFPKQLSIEMTWIPENVKHLRTTARESFHPRAVVSTKTKTNESKQSVSLVTPEDSSVKICFWAAILFSEYIYRCKIPSSERTQKDTFAGLFAKTSVNGRVMCTWGLGLWRQFGRISARHNAIDFRNFFMWWKTDLSPDTESLEPEKENKALGQCQKYKKRNALSAQQRKTKYPTLHSNLETSKRTSTKPL